MKVSKKTFNLNLKKASLETLIGVSALFVIIPYDYLGDLINASANKPKRTG